MESQVFLSTFFTSRLRDEVEAPDKEAGGSGGRPE